MSSRIEEQNKRAIDLSVLERQRTIQKQRLQRAFVSELKPQTSREKPLVAEKPKFEQPTARTPKPAANERTKKFESKEDPLKKDEDTPLKDPKKRTDLKMNDAVKRRSESKSDEKDSHDSDAFFSQAARFATQSPTPAPEAQRSFGATLPSEVINNLVEAVYSSTNADGSRVLTVELKNGILSGAKIRVSTKGSKVNLQFSIDDAEARALLKNSKQLLEKRLEEKNLSLLEFVVH